jgi:hypothetical protein
MAPKIVGSLLAAALTSGMLVANAYAGPNQYPAGGAIGSVAAPFTTNYGDSFQAPQSQFVDDFTFSLTPESGVFDTLAATIDLGNSFMISNLQARLYGGLPPFSSGSLIAPWSNAISFTNGGTTGETVVISPVNLLSGVYTLEIRGDVTGLNGGSYAGVLNIMAQTAPVPEPETYSMMLLGLGLAGFAALRRKRS